MRSFLWIFAVSAIFVGNGIRADERAVIDKAIKAHGGEETLKKYPGIRLKAKGTLHVQGQEIEFTLNGVGFNDQLRNDLKLEAMGQTIEIVQVFDGKKGWVLAMGNTKELDGDELQQMKEQAFHNSLEGVYPLRTDKELEIKQLDDVKVDGKPAACLKITKKGHKEYRMYFDQETGLLVKTWSKSKDMQMQEVDSDSYFRGYKQVQGVMISMKQETRHDDKKYIEAELMEVKLEEKIDAGTFKKP